MHRSKWSLTFGSRYWWTSFTVAGSTCSGADYVFSADHTVMILPHQNHRQMLHVTQVATTSRSCKHAADVPASQSSPCDNAACGSVNHFVAELELSCRKTHRGGEPTSPLWRPEIRQSPAAVSSSSRLAFRSLATCGQLARWQRAQRIVISIVIRAGIEEPVTDPEEQRRRPAHATIRGLQLLEHEPSSLRRHAEAHQTCCSSARTKKDTHANAGHPLYHTCAVACCENRTDSTPMPTPACVNSSRGQWSTPMKSKSYEGTGPTDQCCQLQRCQPAAHPCSGAQAAGQMSETSTFLRRWNTMPGACTMSRGVTAGSPFTEKSGSLGSAARQRSCCFLCSLMCNTGLFADSADTTMQHEQAQSSHGSTCDLAQQLLCPAGQML
jgi:hypothetical protein